METSICEGSAIPMTPQLSSLDHLVLTVVDLTESIAFYSDILGMILEEFTASDGTARFALKFGAQKINLHVSGAEFEPCSARPTPGSADLCFLSDLPMAQWVDHLEAHGVKIEMGPIRRTGAEGPIISVYLRDPDNNLIEVSNRLVG